MKKLTIILLVPVVVFCSCQQGIYFPDRATTTAFTEKHEAKLNLSLSPQEDNGRRYQPASFAAEAAYALTDHIAVTASCRSVSDRETVVPSRFYIASLDSAFRSRGSRVDVGAGYFTRLGGRSRLEILLIYGNGSAKLDGFVYSRQSLGTTEYYFDTRYHRVSIQPAYGIGNDFFSLMTGTKLTYQNFYAINGFRSVNEDQTMVITADYFCFMEPFVDMETGYKFIKFNAQFGFTQQILGEPITDGPLPYASLGITLRYAPRFFKKKEPVGKE